MESLKAIRHVTDPDAKIWLLTGPEWALFISEAARKVDGNILISVYLASPHWRRRSIGRGNLLSELCGSAERLTPRGKLCRAILGRPVQSARVANYNIAAGLELKESGWDVRIVPSAVTLHEKLYIFGESVFVAGSHNLAVSSANKNLDLSVAVQSRIATEQAKQIWWSRWKVAIPINRKGEQNAKSTEPEYTNELGGRGVKSYIGKGSRIL